MSKLVQRFLSMLLCLIMVFGVLPGAVFAEDDAVSDISAVPEIEQQETEPQKTETGSIISDNTDTMVHPLPIYYVSGSFNEWTTGAEDYRMTANGNNTFSLAIWLTEGTYELRVTDSTGERSWGDGSGNYMLTLERNAAVLVNFDEVSGLVTVTDDTQTETDCFNYEVLNGTFCAITEYTGTAKELLIPVIYDCIVDMDSEKAEITVHLMKGLRE